MRSSRVFSLLTGAALLAACGDSNGPSNAAPTAAFDAPTCTLLACQFSGTPSTDADGSVSAYLWDFGDVNSGAQNTASTKDAPHTFSAAGTYNVKLTVTDNGGATNSVTHQVTVSDVPNVPPTADFTFSCADLTCTFTDQSVDPDGGTITTRAWAFGDGQTGSGASVDHTYAAAGDYDVTVTATDNSGGATTSAAKTVSVTAAAPGGPTARFKVSCASLDCTFDNTSGATGSVIVWAWDFGDGQTSSVKNPPVIHYDVNTVTTFTVKLTVTADGVSSTATKEINVAPPATLTCNGADCTLGLIQKSTVVVTLVSHDCQAVGNKFVITAPVLDTLFTDGCAAPVAPDPAATFTLNGGAAFDAGTQLEAEVLSGISGTLKLATNPELRVTGNFANGWELKFDDGAGGPVCPAPNCEPDFNDLIITVKATPAPYAGPLDSTTAAGRAPPGGSRAFGPFEAAGAQPCRAQLPLATIWQLTPGGLALD
jgi:PKD repeat protein